MTGFRSGFVAVVGRPNVGKSTMMNSLVGQKVAIVSDKPQTTRNRIHCILTRSDAQIVFLDTPGIHKPLHKLGEYMVKTALRTLNEVDAVVFVVDASDSPGRGDEFVAAQLQKVDAPVILAANKVDLWQGTVGEEEQQAILAAYAALGSFHTVLPVSAIDGSGLVELVDTVIEQLPEGPKYYPDDWITDHPEQFVMAELIREKVLLLTREEIPHATAVIVDKVEAREDRDLVDVWATIYVERRSQKGIVIGRGGSMLKDVGKLARQDIEALLGSQVNLQLWVKVKDDWRERAGTLSDFGYTLDS
ncbi:MAG: GTPase Era [Firmicutes bacterium]|jgi:GTP-binding protein Era|nr:GTPase Era [Bacillota bacterium]